MVFPRVPFSDLYSLIFLFLICLMSSELFVYADDVILLKFFHPFDVLATCSALNTDLKSIAEWSTNNPLHLNPSKSSLLIVGSSTLLSRIQSFDSSLNSISISCSSSIKILDVHVDSSWSFESHKGVKCRAAYTRLRLLSPLPQGKVAYPVGYIELDINFTVQVRI